MSKRLVLKKMELRQLTPSELDAYAPGFAWSAWLAAADVGAAGDWAADREALVDPVVVDSEGPEDQAVRSVRVQATAAIT